MLRSGPGDYVSPAASNTRCVLSCSPPAGLGFDIVFEGSGLEERGIDRKTGARW